MAKRRLSAVVILGNRSGRVESIVDKFLAADLHIQPELLTYAHDARKGLVE